VALVVGLIFGLFHVSLFRLAPTAFLGVLFAAATMNHGIDLPGDALARAETRHQPGAPALRILLAELEGGTYLAAAGVLAAAFWILWRNRNVYPGLRAWGTGASQTKG